jgi:hypothetical protein
MNRVGVGLSVAGVVALVWFGFCEWRGYRQQGATQAAVQAAHALVDAGLDARPTALAPAEALVADAIRWWPSGDATGVASLVAVWRRDVLGVRLDPHRFDALVDAQPASLPGRVARSLVGAAQCRFEAACRDEERAYVRLDADLLGTRWDPLRAPLLRAWIAVWVERGYRDDDRAAWSRVLASCRASPEQLDESAPDAVLGPCLAAAGAVRDFDQWFAWTGFAGQPDVVAPWGADEARLQRVFSSPSPGCRDLPLRLSPRWGALVPQVSTAEQGFCYAAGMLALGCAHQAAEVIASGRRVAPTVPWSALTRSFPPGLTRRCYLDR